MDKSQNMGSVLGRPKISVPGYTIEMGNTTYGTSLEERIQAARAASCSNQMLPKNNIGKSTLMNTRNNEKISFNAHHESKKRNRHQWPSSSNIDYKLIPKVSSLNSTTVKNGNINPQTNYKPIHKGGGLMQRRLESIKANKKLSNISLDYDKNVGSTKCPNNFSQSSNHQDNFTKSHVSSQFDENISMQNECKTKSTIQKKKSSDMKNDCINNNINKLSKLK